MEEGGRGERERRDGWKGKVRTGQEKEVRERKMRERVIGGGTER